MSGGSAAGDQYAFLALDNGSTITITLCSSRSARTGWFINRNNQEKFLD